MAISKDAIYLSLQPFVREKLGLEIPPLQIGPTIAVSLATLCFLLFFLVYHIVIAVQRKRTDTILLVGLSGSGKTTLFYQLRDGSIHKGTVTSMEPNTDRFILHSELAKKEKAKPARIVDLPGHLRLRAKIDEFLRDAGGIIFLVDAVDFISNVRTTAEYLYEVLTKAWVVKKKIPMLIVCNKMDKVTAHAPDFIRKQLEKEIEKLRLTQNAMSEADATSEATLGKEGEPFKLAHCANKVTVEEASVITNQIMNIEEFIRSCIR